MFRLDYLSCFLTVLATVLVGRKLWTGLLISIVNSLIVCGGRTNFLSHYSGQKISFAAQELVCNQEQSKR